MAQSKQSRIEQAVIAVLAWLTVLLPTAWVSMLLTGAVADSTIPYWQWLLVCGIGMLIGEGIKQVWRRWRSRKPVNR